MHGPPPQMPCMPQPRQTFALYEPLERAKDAKARCGIAGERHKVGSARCPRALSVVATVLYVPKLPRRQESPRKHT